MFESMLLSDPIEKRKGSLRIEIEGEKRRYMGRSNGGD